MFYCNQLLILLILLPIFWKPFFHSAVRQQEQGGKMINLKPVNLILLLAIVKGLLREKIEAICKMRFMFVCGFPLSMLFLVPISRDNQELDESKTIVLEQDLVAVRNHN